MSRYRRWLKLLLIFYMQPLCAYPILEDFPDFDTCPFFHNDHYAADVNRLHDIIASHLRNKLDANQLCYGPFNTISQNLISINELFSVNRSSNRLENIRDEVLSKQLLQLELDLVAEPKESLNYLSIAEKIRAVEDSIYNNEINRTFNRDFYQEAHDNRVLAATFNHMNNVINSLANLPPQCVDLLGGWQIVVPTVLNSISSLSGLSGFAYSAIIGSGVRLIASLGILLQDIHVKAAIRDIVRHKNNKILACTYFSVQNTACEYQYALRRSQDETAIKNAIKQRYENQDTRIYDMYFTLLEHSRDFERVFYNIAAMGSAVSFDPEMVGKYFQAQLASPKTILDPGDIGPPPREEEEGLEADRRRQEWLIRIKERGIFFRSHVFLAPRTLKEQVQEALVDISLKIAEIQSVEFILGRRRSFLDLKHELATDPHLLGKVRRFIEFFQLLLKENLIRHEKRGVLVEALRLLEELKDFLSISYSDFEDIGLQAELDDPEAEANSAFERYRQKVNAQGKRLFGVMAEGSVAYINNQTLLTIGQKVQDRILRVFRLLEEEFLTEDVLAEREHRLGRFGAVKYSSYKRSRSVLVKVAANYQNFVGSGKTFRAEDVEVAMRALEKGFSREIRKMLKESLSTESRYYPLLNGETAAHLCALYSTFLGRKGLFRGSANRLAKYCRSRYSELELLNIVKPGKMPIDWDNPCFYHEYRRLLTLQQSLYRKMLKLGFEIDAEDNTIRPSEGHGLAASLGR